MEFRFTFPEGRKKVLTFSYDDGKVADRQLVPIFNRYGLKATFHLNSGMFGQVGRIEKEEVRELYAGHEVACHCKCHLHPANLPLTTLVDEIKSDREALEELVGYPVCGMSYPFGEYSNTVINAMRQLGIVYSRTADSTRSFILPEDFMVWKPSSHHSGNIAELGKKLIDDIAWGGVLQCLYIWGHSYEFPQNNEWGMFEDFCAMMQPHGDQIWFATNMQIYEYMEACRNLRTTMDGSIVTNRSALSVWLDVNGKIRELKSGETLRLTDVK